MPWADGGDTLPGPAGGGYPAGGGMYPAGGVPCRGRGYSAGGYPARGVPCWGEGGYPVRTTEGVLSTRQAICLLRSRRRTFLLIGGSSELPMWLTGCFWVTFFGRWWGLCAYT